MLLAIALILFAIQVVAWVLLPASAGTPVVAHKEEATQNAEMEPAYATNA